MSVAGQCFNIAELSEQFPGWDMGGAIRGIGFTCGAREKCSLLFVETLLHVGT